jgi:hypothetical protein
VGATVGSGAGEAVGARVGETVGSGVGGAVGSRVGEAVGSGVGGTVGSGVGEAVGSGVGEEVGFGVGEALGFGVGEAVGFGVGEAVGFGVGVTSGSGVEVSADIATYEDSLYDLASLVTGSSMVMPNPMKLDKNTKADTPDIIKCFFGDCFLTSFIIASNINTGMHIRLIRTKNARTVFIEYPLFL